MTSGTRAGFLILGLTAGLAGCDDATPQPPTGPSPIQQAPRQSTSPSAFPPGVLSDNTLSGVVFELTAKGRAPIEAVAVYCELCGASTHNWASTDSDGFYTFTGVWNAGVLPTSLSVGKAGYVDPPGLPAVTPPNPSGPGWRQVMVIGDTRFDIELVRR
jgi:hypothetical protein